MANTRYKLSDTDLDKINCKLLYVTTARYDSDWHSTIHFHNFTEIFYVVRGDGSFIVEDSEFEVKADDMIIVNPNVSHTEVSNEQSPLEYIALGIEGLLFSQIIKNENTHADYFLQNYQDYKHEVLFYLKTLVAEVENKEDHYDRLCQDLLEVCIINMIRRANNSFSIASTKKMNKECSYVKQYIDLHYQENITLDELSRLTYVNKYYLVHAFKKYIGLSPINYLINKRVEEAKVLLETTNYSVSQISDIVGFSSQSYFSQVFKKTMGTTPFEIRKRKREEKTQ